MTNHNYDVNIVWTGNNGTGTSDYQSYSRNHEINIKGKPKLAGSSDSIFRGDASCHNPEDMLVTSLSACHMLWYLHLCADAGVIVTSYEDHATGVLELDDKKSGKFTEVILHPKVLVQDKSMIEKAQGLHDMAHQKCFIANSCNFPVLHQPTCESQ